ncbi:hypothetical protein [Streptomyces sp. NPDC057253]|uniref:hypothetical protein n=1 Tax=Streptomyces sp. NPDC057253 TaxID=3346069 RepID=UPI0036257CA8
MMRTLTGGLTAALVAVPLALGCAGVASADTGGSGDGSVAGSGPFYGAVGASAGPNGSRLDVVVAGVGGESGGGTGAWGPYYHLYRATAGPDGAGLTAIDTGVGSNSPSDETAVTGSGN